MVPPIAITAGKGRAAVRLLLGADVREVSTTEQTAAAKKPRAAPGLAGRWRWTATPWAAGQTTLTGLRKAGPLLIEVQGIVAATRNGYTQRSWVWRVERGTDRKGTPPATQRGKAPDYPQAVRLAYEAAIALEGEVCGVRTVARNTRAGRTFEAASLATARRSSSQKREPVREDSVELEPDRTKNGRKTTSGTTAATRRNGKSGQKATGARNGKKAPGNAQGSLFG